MAVVAAHVGRRCPREQFPADDLRIRLEQAQAVAMTAAGELLLTQIGERRFELDVAGEQLVGGTIAGFLMSLQMPVSVRNRMRSPRHSCVRRHRRPGSSMM